jgi:hypothetical protein
MMQGRIGGEARFAGFRAEGRARDSKGGTAGRILLRTRPLEVETKMADEKVKFGRSEVV